jgi:hypothetical protein
MAKLTTCPDCRAAVSTRAAACPACGRPMRKAARHYGCGTIFLVLLAIGFLAVAFSGGGNRGGRPASPAPRPPVAPPTGPPIARQPAPGGLSESERRAIYADLHRAGMLATYLAGREVPFDSLSTDPTKAGRMLEARKKIYDEEHAKNRAEVAAAHGVDEATMEAINSEGDRARWPLPKVPNPYAGPR